MHSTEAYSKYYQEKSAWDVGLQRLIKFDLLAKIYVVIHFLRFMHLRTKEVISDSKCFRHVTNS
jgi:heme/copper-type cytochrome/quinol oxidase subunit 4